MENKNNFQFKGNIWIYGKIKLLTGLHIGGTKEGVDIGGVDSPVIKLPAPISDFVNPFEDKPYTLPEDAPYIPGSSLKGKMRSLLEWEKEKLNIKPKKKEKSDEIEGYFADVHKCEEEDCSICVIFGKSAEGITKTGPTRLKVYDAYLLKSSLETLEEATDKTFTELKTETSIDRLTSQANPRTFERVPAGAEFFFEMKFSIYKENDIPLIKDVFVALKLVEDDGLGGSISRGYGRIEIKDICLKLRKKTYYEGKKEDEVSIRDKKRPEEIIKEWDEIEKQLKEKLGMKE